MQDRGDNGLPRNGSLLPAGPDDRFGPLVLTAEGTILAGKTNLHHAMQ
jgi:hypothetical protein